MNDMTNAALSALAVITTIDKIDKRLAEANRRAEDIAETSGLDYRRLNNLPEYIAARAEVRSLEDARAAVLAKYNAARRNDSTDIG